MNRQRGFTLLELVIAIAIFSLLGLATYRLLHGVLRSETGIRTHEVQLRQLQRAVGVLERDLTQLLLRPANGESGYGLALRGDQNSLQLVRGSWRNPLDDKRSEVLEVTYHWDGGVLLRESGPPPVAGQAPLPLQRQRLLEGMHLKQLRFLDQRGERHEYWPISGSSHASLRALEWIMDAPGYPGIRRLLLMPEAPTGHAGSDSSQEQRGDG